MTADSKTPTSQEQLDLLKSILIDPSTLDNGTLEATGDHALFQGALALPSLQKAAGEVCAKVRAAMDNSTDNPAEFLITADPDLTTRDAVLRGVRSDLTSLSETVSNALEEVEKLTAPEPEIREAVAGSVVLGATASVVPSVINLFSTKKTAASFTTTIEDIHVLTAVAHQFHGAGTSQYERVYIDGFRTIDPGHPLVLGIDELRNNHAALSGHNAVLKSRVAQQDAREKAQQASLDALQKDRTTATSTEAAQQVDRQIEDALRELDRLQQDGESFRDASAVIDKLVTDVGAFITTVNTPGADGRSLLTTAVLQAWLHEATPGTTRYVLYVKLFGATADQLTLDGRFGSRDEIGVRNDTALTLVLVDAAGAIVRADTVSATAALLQSPKSYFHDAGN